MSMNPSNRTRVIAFFFIIYATMFLFGLVENVKGVSFPLIKAEFGVPYDSQGGLVSATWFGYVIFCLIASLFLERFGIKRSLITGYLLIGAGTIATLFAPSFWIATLTLLIINAGFGFYEVGNNALATVAFTTRAALMLNLMHFFYGVGAILGPKTAGLLTDTWLLNWRQVYLVVLIPVALVLLYILITPFGSKAETPHTEGEQVASKKAKVTFFGAFRNPIVWLFCFTLGFMEVIEFGAANWGGLYLQDVYNLDPRVVGASFVSLFYILFTVSRLLSGLAIEKLGYIRSLFLSLICSILIFAVGFSLGINGIWLLPVTGFFIAIMFPTMMAVTMQVFGDDAPTVSSAIITGSGAVNGVFKLVVGLTNQYAGEAWGYRSCLLYAILSLVLMSFLAVRIKQARAERAVGVQPIEAA